MYEQTQQTANGIHYARPLARSVISINKGVGCPRCGSQDIRQKHHTTGAGWGLFFFGLLAALPTLGISLILCVVALFLEERRGRCQRCRWTWRT